MPRRDLIAVLRPAVFLLLETNGHRQRQLLRISSDDCEIATDLRDGFAEVRRRGLGVTLRLGNELGLRKLLKLPIAARNDLDELLRFEMDRLSPFTPEEVHFAHRILQVIAEERCILVEVQIAPRRIIDRALATCKYLNLKPNRLELAGSTGGEALDLLPRHAMMDTRVSRVDWALAILALVFVGLLTIIPLQQQHGRVSDLEHEVVVEESRAEKALKLRQELDVVTSELQYLTERRSRTLMNTRVLAELTRLIPDEAYLVELHISDPEIRIRGSAESIPDVIAVLDGSALLFKPAFLSPITRDPQTGLEHFHISVGLRKEG